MPTTLVPILTAYEKEHLSERQPLPAAYLGLSTRTSEDRFRFGPDRTDEAYYSAAADKMNGGRSLG